jgi:type I site-specific restriction endonuclease
MICNIFPTLLKRRDRVYSGNMIRNEAQTCFELIDPVLHNRGWTTAHIKVEASAGAYERSEDRQPEW